MVVASTEFPSDPGLSESHLLQLPHRSLGGRDSRKEAQGTTGDPKNPQMSQVSDSHKKSRSQPRQKESFDKRLTSQTLSAEYLGPWDGHVQCAGLVPTGISGRSESFPHTSWLRLPKYPCHWPIVLCYQKRGTSIIDRSAIERRNLDQIYSKKSKH